jgi:site-specific recombinase XerD
MHAELFNRPTALARYRAGLHFEAREHYLRRLRSEGYSHSTLQRIAWVLLIVAEAACRQGGSVSAVQLETLISRRIRLSSGRRPSEHTASMIRHFGADWLRSIGALAAEPAPPVRFARELDAFTEYMRIERGLSLVTIATCNERMRWFFASLSSRARSLADVSIEHIDAYLEGAARAGWSRSSLHALGGSLRSFFRYASQRGWCGSSIAVGIDLPRLYALADVPKAPAIDDVGRLLDTTATGSDPVTIRDHAILSLLIHYGLRRGEVERLTLDDIDWSAEMLHVTARPRCSERAVFLTIKAPHRPLSGASISAMVRMRLVKQGVKLDRIGAHCLRHACAGQLMDAGFTLKEIADHLGHRSMNSTRIYTKIDMRGLRQVAELDLGALI